MPAGTQATFRCNAIADPSLDLQISWLHNGEPIDFDEAPRFVKSSDYSLTITKTIELDSGTYTCVARTELDEEIAQATLTVQGTLFTIFIYILTRHWGGGVSLNNWYFVKSKKKSWSP